MPIPESQLETWSHQGTVPQSSVTYQAIKKVLEDPNAPYASKTPSVSVYRQGSYENDTNIWSESDVDVVCQLDNTYYADTSALNPSAQSAYTGAFGGATYDFCEFRMDVLAWLQKNYGTTVYLGTKAIHIRGNGYRRDADVVVCCSHRRYRANSTGTDSLYDSGVSFFASGQRIDNFPKQHSINCTAKHQSTNSWFKPVVRIFKNARNTMIGKQLTQDGLAPSYFLDGMLYNVPNELYGGSYKSSVMAAHAWLLRSDKTKLVCTNGLHWLCRDDSSTSWSRADCDAFLDKFADFWNGW